MQILEQVELLSGQGWQYRLQASYLEVCCLLLCCTVRSLPRLSGSKHICWVHSPHLQALASRPDSVCNELLRWCDKLLEPPAHAQVTRRCTTRTLGTCWHPKGARPAR